ncbi:MAG: DUF445 domain-containing protein [Mycobacteriaceae bacterium]
MDINLQSNLAKTTDLRRMKLLATGFFGFATLVYLLCRWLEFRGAGAWTGYVRAASEAGMVGALADWFAVTALFRHPLGLPIPHTAIIKRKKDQLGANLGTFVQDNFLSAELVSAKVSSAQVPARVGAWLADPQHADQVAAEVSNGLRVLVDILRDEDIHQVIDASIVRRLAEPLWGPPVGRVLGKLLEENRQLPLIQLLCERAYQWALASQETIDRVITRDSPTWSPKFVDAIIGERIHHELVVFTDKLRSHPEHELRLAMNRFLADFSQDLQTDSETIARAEAVKAELMGRKEIAGASEVLWRSAKKLIMDSVNEPSSPLRVKISEFVQRIGNRLREDVELQIKVDHWVGRGVRHAVSRYGTEITAIITETVQRWDAEEASRRIELQVGKDLQFIRINGTVVGALAGLLIYTLSQWIFAG